MADNYFKKFPLVNYNNYLAVNITERVIVTYDAFKNPYLFYRYDVKDGQRPDQLADKYYNDQFMDWSLYLVNNMTDPYYDWYLDEGNFVSYLLKKYNTDMHVLQSKVMFYRNNWYENEDKITISEYASLANTVHRYWQPYYNNGAIVAGYERVREDWTINTNSIRKYTANSSSFSDFIKNEIVDINFDISHKGVGQVVIANSSSITLNNISGTSLANSTVLITGSSCITGRESLANAAISTSVNIVDNLLPEETIYWSPVTIYDSERETNELKKSINVLDNRYSSRISKELTKLMKT